MGGIGGLLGGIGQLKVAKAQAAAINAQTAGGGAPGGGGAGAPGGGGGAPPPAAAAAAPGIPADVGGAAKIFNSVQIS